ncbi:MFS transporter [Pantoea sp.]|uniref:MFS transporter n=1 Tax=Pantoea sp. TaxID=69393 RepID=UPI0031E27516
MQTNNITRWLTLAVISISGGISFDLAYLRYIYQIPMAKFMGFTNTEIGLIMSTFGITAILLYAPGGIISDKFSHRKVMSGAMIATGLLGLIMATYPPLWAMLLIQVAFAITTILLLWAVSIKAASLLGTREEQGKIMGWMEGLRGVGVMGLALFTVWVFAQFHPDDPNSLKAVILIYSGTYIALGIACWFLVSDGFAQHHDDEPSAFSLQHAIRVLKMPTTWYCSMIIFGVYTLYAILSYSTNYLSEIYGMSLVAASYMGIIINKVFRAICGPMGGMLTSYSRWRSPTRVIQVFALVSFTTLILLWLVTRQPVSLVLAIGLILLMAFTCYASRGLYFACIGEVNTPKQILGTTIGICSVIGFLPDVFVYPVIGYWQDTLPPVLAYRNMWMMGATASVLVLVFTALLMGQIKRVAATTALAKGV